MLSMMCVASYFLQNAGGKASYFTDQHSAGDLSEALIIKNYSETLRVKITIRHIRYSDLREVSYGNCFNFQSSKILPKAFSSKKLLIYERKCHKRTFHFFEKKYLTTNHTLQAATRKILTFVFF